MLNKSVLVRFTTLLFMGVLLGGCTHAMHLYHVSEIERPPKNAKVKKISSMAEQQVILGFVTETNYVNGAFIDLQRQCLKGSITGIHTRYSTSHSFFSWKNKVKMSGYCIK